MWLGGFKIGGAPEDGFVTAIDLLHAVHQAAVWCKEAEPIVLPATLYLLIKLLLIVLATVLVRPATLCLLIKLLLSRYCP